MPEVMTFGETMGLMVPAGQQHAIQSAAHFRKSFGGAESNVAIGIARLGHRAGWFGSLGDDPFGHYIYKAIRGEGVDVSQVQFSQSAPTGLMFRQQTFEGTSVYYYRSNSAASHFSVADLNETYMQKAKILHVTGITPALSDTCREAVFRAVELARSNNVKVSFDPNLRLKLWSLAEAKRVLLPLAAMCDYFLPGLEELQLLYGTDDWKQLISHLQELDGVSIVKGGKHETWIVSKDKASSIPFERVAQVDPIGAGDAFCAGFLVGMLKGWAIDEAVRLGNLNGAIVVQGYGDWEALPSWEQIATILEKRKRIER